MNHGSNLIWIQTVSYKNVKSCNWFWIQNTREAKKSCNKYQINELTWSSFLKNPWHYILLFYAVWALENSKFQRETLRTQENLLQLFTIPKTFIIEFWHAIHFKKITKIEFRSRESRNRQNNPINQIKM